MDEEMIERSPEAMNDPENVVFKREKEEKFVRSYDEIKAQLDKIKKERSFQEDLMSKGILGNQLYILNVVEYTLLWMLNNNNDDVLPFEHEKGEV